MSGSDGHYPYVGDHPQEVETARSELNDLGSSLLTLAGDVQRDTASIKEAWPQGRTGQVAAQDAERMSTALDECHQVFKNAAQALEFLHPVLVNGRRKVDDLNESYRVLCAQESWLTGGSKLADLLDDGHDLRAAQVKSGFDFLADIDHAYQVGVVTPVTEESGYCNTTLRRLTDQGRGPAGRAAGETRYDVSFGLLAAYVTPQAADILSGRTPSDPKVIHDAWLELSAAQQMHLLKGDPARFGNLNGIPAKDRETANRVLLQNQVDQVTAALKAAGMDPTANPEVFEGWDADGQIQILGGDILGTPTNPVRDAIANAGMSMDQAKHALRVNRELNPAGKSTKASLVHLLAYEPGADDENGRAALVYGDVDGAENVAVCVPGLNSTLGNFQNVSGDALNLFNAAQKTDPNKHTAVIAWQGYDAPNFHEVADQGHAEVGAKLLAADVNALRVTHDGPIKGKLTVVGHSYGSTVTGLALQREHLQVDQVALIGSPGVGGGAETAADLGLDKNTLFVGADSRDIVTSGTREFFHSLGADPTFGKFGESVTRFKAENVNRGDHINFADHSLYYDAKTQSESLHSLSRIVTGYGDTLRQEGMLAEPRHTVPRVPGNPYSHAWVDDREG
ncbi:MAG: hypothetical protein QOE58_2324, partial [Actinomycetota bacterium]|nr:hypothetical protein [Actinomycetota bacterium]